MSYHSGLRILGFACALLFIGAPAAFGQEPITQLPWETPTATAAAPGRSIPAGEKMKVKGTIVDRDGNTFTLRENDGGVLTFVITHETSIKSRGFLNTGDHYSDTELVRGFYIEVEGRGNGLGQLEATKIRFDKDELRTARSIETRVTPAEHRLTSLEAQTRALSGQVDELNEASKIMRNDIDTNSQNIAATDKRVTATNDRISMVDDFEMAKEATVLFELDSAVLTPEAKTALDQIAKDALAMDGYVIEVAGFTDSTGSVLNNRALSQRRAAAVVQYLGESCNVPLRRIITPFGYGELNPVADNATPEGRMQNRRVHVMVLISKGITGNVP